MGLGVPLPNTCGIRCDPSGSVKLPVRARPNCRVLDFEQGEMCHGRSVGRDALPLISPIATSPPDVIC